MEDLERLLNQFRNDRTLQLTEQLIEINRKIRLIMGDQFETQVVAWEEAFVKVMKAQNCGIIEASINIARTMRDDGVPLNSISVMFACAIELLIHRGKYGK